MADQLTPWEHINRFYHTTRKPIQLLVAYHADAAAASITLTTLLKACFVPFNLHPVMEYEEVKGVIQRTNMTQDAEISDGGAPVDELFVLIGLGAPVSLRSFFDLRRHIVIVLDSYRPFLLDNLRASDNNRLVLWGHERIHEEVEQFFREQRKRELARARRRRRRRTRKNQRRLRAYGELVNDDDDEEREEESEISSGSSDDGDDDENHDDMTPSQSQEGIDWMNEEVPENLEQLYYAAERGGKSCALEVYDLAILLNRVKEAVLWHAAVGVCDLFTRRLIDYGTYLVEMRRLHNEVTLRKGIRRGPLDDVTEETVNRHHKIASSNTMQLVNLDEDQLFLLRHYSLWGAMWYHPVVASLLGLHHVEDGTGTLRQLLARCGVSAKLAQQPWGEIPDDVRVDSLRLVHHELKQALKTRGSFVKWPTRIWCVARTTGYSVEVSTFDVCTLFTALLAKVPPGAMNTEEASEESMKEKLREFRREQFWRAHDVIDADPNSNLFVAAVQEAKMLQESVATATSALMQPGMIQSTKGIHYTQPSDPTNASTALETFGCPFRIAVLAEHMLFALTVERGLGKYTREVRPVLLSCPVSRLIGLNSQQKQKEEVIQSEEAFIVLFAHEGPTKEGLSPVLPVARWNECVTNTEDFLVPPLRDFIRRDTVIVDGRESTAHLGEMLHLRSLTAAL
ncbi:putative cell division cycle protein 45 (CDC45) [Trypanosoma cruzi]|uniref:Cell division cycle protein 45 (CDC45), putative n=1 Tax=Trypanosoma cruzi (strain CL Brener) TaxID=353153 RepID=Q4DUZ6_TRYCC|nr:cell division cycle protein 45 (CDC45), putative [Trypanosoma cruzi]EAN96366.1 cell division cycle protein 45 (CDC45), putative [Trypanosoma cruzi]RNC61830.1 putative cell division cycle protein 45 (CDC45) [Trypanosoma cruzi]|eukprot:XP_818217.1 cell division cycle protein 45 (CDC45) [Trypanosoma cruzi strain CL Brener]